MSAEDVTNPGIQSVLRALDNKDRRDADRHIIVTNELQSIRGTLREHDARIQRVERNAFPTLSVWAIVLVLSVGVATVWIQR